MQRAFFACIWNPQDPFACEQAGSLKRKITGRSCGKLLTHEEAGYLFRDLSSTPWAGSARILNPRGQANRKAFLFGDFFDAGFRDHRPTEKDVSSWLNSQGSTLLEDWWGPFVCFLQTGRGWSVIADPAGSVPCYYAHISGLTYIFSHLDLCSFLAPSQFTIDPGFLSRMLVYDRVPGPDTALKEVKELLPGVRLDVGPDHLATRSLWNPEDIARKRLDVSLAEATEKLSWTVRGVVSRQRQVCDRIILSLSGGLDSSIVLGCLSTEQGPADLLSVHHLLGETDQPEVRFARAAAEYSGCRLKELIVEPSQRLPATDRHPLTPRPFRQFLQPDITSLFDNIPGIDGATVFTGQGGDHLFLTSNSPDGFFDYLADHGPSPNALRELSNASRLSGRSAIAVLKSVADRPKSTGIIAALETRLAEFGLEPGLAHQWLPDWATSPAGIPRGKAGHLSRLVHLYNLQEPLRRSATVDICHPLIARPLIGLSLQLPVYQLCAGGTSRGLARLAFKNDLPDVIRLRVTKGYASGHFRQQTEANRDQLDRTLRRGLLSKSGLLPSGYLDRILDPSFGHARTSLTLYTIESWMQSWRAAQMQAS